MQPPIIVNESRSMEIAGDVSIFSSVHAAELYFEPWYVDESYFAFDGTGRRLKMIRVPDENREYLERVKIVAHEDTTLREDVLRQYLVDNFLSLVQVRGWEFSGVSRDWIENATLQDLCRLALKFATE